MHVLITGGAGFIGSYLVQLHMKRGDSVHVIDDMSTGHIENIVRYFNQDNFRLTTAALLVWDGLEKAVAWSDRMYHMAAVVGVKRVLEDPVRVMSANIAATERLLRAVHKGGWNPQVLIASSSEVYGFNAEAGFSEESDLLFKSAGRLRWSYAATKLADEYLAFSFARKYDLNITVARLFNTIGPRQVGRYGMVLPNFIEQAIHNEPITVFGNGTQTRSFCDVRDTAAQLELLAGYPQAYGEVFNVGNDQEITIRNLAELVRERAESISTIVTIPYHQAYGEEFEDVTHRRPILTKINQLTGFSPRWTLTDTVDDMIARKRRVVEIAISAS